MRKRASAFRDGVLLTAFLLALFACGRGLVPLRPGDSAAGSPHPTPTPGGILDKSFGAAGTGQLTLNFNNGPDVGNALAFPSDGDVLVAGSITDGSGNTEFGIARYLANGTLDTSFGTGGLRTLLINGNEVARAIALQPSDGKIVVAGTTMNAGVPNLALARLALDGTLDPAFNGGNPVTLALNGVDTEAWAVAVQPSDGKIVVAGHNLVSAGNYDFAIIRFNTDGTLDTSAVIALTSQNDVARAVAIQPDGKILVAGASSFVAGTQGDFAVVRCNADLSLDTSFDHTGTEIIPISAGADEARALAVQADGRILIGGSARNGAVTSFTLVRLLPTGVLDPSFGSGGKAVSAPSGSAQAGVIYGLAVQSDGKIVAGGSMGSATTSEFALLRFLSSGVADTSFGTSGLVLTSFTTGLDVAYALGLQADGKIVLAGTAKGNAFALARYKP